ncbi:hypothetical protein ACIRL3_25460 [Streptomyces sp. NPDC102384]|uniref:hypothetical protein n=1 Tax=Streptomyces sp. NPDC102384 TaxID=3366166 RepID=UPI00382AC70E
MRTLHKYAALTATALVTVGGLGISATAASAASTVGSSACTVNTKNATYRTTTSGVNLRRGPSTGYASKGQLGKGTTAYVVCFKEANNGIGVSNKPDWAYSKVTSGANKGTVGWIADSNIKK